LPQSPCGAASLPSDGVVPSPPLIECDPRWQLTGNMSNIRSLAVVLRINVFSMKRGWCKPTHACQAKLGVGGQKSLERGKTSRRHWRCQMCPAAHRAERSAETSTRQQKKGWCSMSNKADPPYRWMLCVK
jgi:hypothetical protein